MIQTYLRALLPSTHLVNILLNILTQPFVYTRLVESWESVRREIIDLVYNIIRKKTPFEMEILRGTYTVLSHQRRLFNKFQFGRWDEKKNKKKEECVKI